MKWKSLMAVLLGLLMIGVTADYTNAQVFGHTTFKTSSVSETTFVSAPKPEIEMISTFGSWNKEYDYYNLNNPEKDGDGKATYIW